jgi:hypothetical protein
MRTIPVAPAWTALALAGVLAGCATAPPHRAPTANRFLVNGAAITVQPEQLQAIRQGWSGDVLAQAAASGSVPADRQWILDLIALSEELGTTPCRRLAFERIEPMPLKPFVARVAIGPNVTFDPHKYNENWHIDACGVHHRWRVMDDANNRSQELTVLLLGDQPAR